MHAFAVLYVDAHLIVADKPAGLLAVPGRQEPDCLAARLQARWPDARVVHRLDMATSGLMVFGRGAEAQRRLSVAFERRAVHKRYIAVASGMIAADAGEIDLPLAADWPNRPRQIVDPVRGKASLTRWRVLARHPAAGGATPCGDGPTPAHADGMPAASAPQRPPGATTRVELEPLTGRSHQLRVHLMAIGHPLVGDEFYAPPAVRAAAPRLLLHASRLALAHPASDEPLNFESPAPF